MIKKTLCFSNPAYLSLKDCQLVIKLPEVEKAELPESFKKSAVTTIPIEDIGVIVIDNKQITITSGLMSALLENNCAIITCDNLLHGYAGVLSLWMSWYPSNSVVMAPPLRGRLRVTVPIMRSCALKTLLLSGSSPLSSHHMR